MIIISDCNKDIVIPAGLGDNPGVVYEKSGVESLNGQQGDLTLKTVNGNELLGEGDVAIDTGVESLNGQKGALNLKTVNGNDMLGDGNIEIKGGVETVNGETGDVKIKTVNGQSLMGEGDVPVDVGVETLNGQKGNLKIKSVNGAEMLGEGNVVIDTGVETLNGQKGALTLKTVNGNELTGDGNIEIQAGSDIINLDGLTQEEIKAVYEKIDQTKLPTFIYNGAISIYSYTVADDLTPEQRSIEFYSLRAEGGGMHLVLASINPDGNIREHGKPQNYVNSLFINVSRHVSENADFQCSYAGDLGYIKTLATRPNSYFIFFTNGIGDTKKPVFAPVSVIWDNKKFDGNSPFRIQFTANEKLYTYLHGDTDGKWLFESAKPITGGGATNALTYKQITNENRQEVYDDVKAHWSDASGYTGNYVYFYQKGKDQIIFDEVKFENNNAYFNSVSVTFTSGQVNNPGVRLLCSIVPSEGDVQIAEKYTTISSIDGMQYLARGEVNSGSAISFDSSNYGNGYGIYSTVNTGEANGLFGVRFRDGLDSYKGNTPANIFTDGTDVFMAFDVIDYHYVYKVQENGPWAFVSKTKIGGVQSSEVSNIKVLTQAEYDALTTKDENVLYCIKG